jgi:type II secretory pathway component GspD/PulD (secretin)
VGDHVRARARRVAAGLLLAAAAGCQTVETTPPRPEFAIETAVQQPAAPLPPAPIAQEPSTAEQAAARRAALHARFGSQVLVKPDGRITKQYFLSKESGRVLLNLLAEPGQPAPPAHQRLTVGGRQGASMLARMLGRHALELLYVENFETLEGVGIANPVTVTALKPIPSKPHDLLLVTAEPDGLAAFEDAMNLFFANIPQVEIEVKVVEYTTTDGLAVGVDQLDAGLGTPPVIPTLDNLSSDQLVDNLISRFPLNPPLVGSSNVSDRGIISLGGIHDSWQLAAQLQLLETRGIADVLSSPRMVVRNGGTASVMTRTDLPYPQAQISNSGQNITANIVFKPVGITLNIRPVIAGTETVILQIYANVGAVTSFAATDPVATPVISSREVLTSVHVSHGKTTVIGGLVSRSTITNETKFPILGDIPVLGWLFRSTSTATTRTTLQFHITPRILQGPRGFQDASLGG